MTVSRIEPLRDEETLERPAIIPAPPSRSADAPARASVSERCPGRERELTLLERAAHSIESERLVLVRGPSGIGKSRLLDAFKSGLRLEGGIVLEGTCEAHRPYGPFAEIVDRALHFLDEVGTPLQSLDPSLLSGFSRRDDRGEGLRHEGAPRAARGLVGIESLALERRLRFFDAVAALLREVSRVRPPVVLIHRLEQADVGTLQLLSFLLDEGALVVREPAPLSSAPAAAALPALFVASVCAPFACAETVSAALDRLAHLDVTEIVTLGPLDASGLRAFLGSEETIARLLARTGGHPDLLDLLLEAEPMTERSRVRRCLDALEPAPRAMLEALAVLGRPASLETLALIADVEAGSVHDLSRIRLVTRSLLEAQVCFSFERETQRAEVYELIPVDRRRALHGRAVEACARERSRAEAVRHALASGDVERASSLARAAAASLSARHAHDEAAALLELLVEKAPSVPLELRVELVSLHRAAGHYRDALAHACWIRANAPEDPAAVARVGELLSLLGDLDGATSALEAARQLAAEARPAHPLLATLHAELAEVHYRAGRYPEALAVAERAIRLARDFELPAGVIEARNILGKLALAQRQHAHAIRFFEENGEEARLEGLTHLEAQAWTNLAIAHLQRDDLEGAERWCLRAIEVATLASDTRDRAIATENLAVLAHLARDYARALSLYATAARLLERLGNRAMTVRVLRNLGELHLSLGDAKAARTLAERATRLTGHATPPAVTAERLVLRGRIELEDGCTEEARSAFEAALEIFLELGDARADDLRLELVTVALLEGDVSRAEALLDPVARAGGVPTEGKRHVVLALALAALARAKGEDTTRELAERAVEAAEAFGDDERLLQARVLHAQVLLDAAETGLAGRARDAAREVDERLSASVPEPARVAWEARSIRREMQALDERFEALARISESPRRGSSAPPAARTGQLIDGSPLVGSSAGMRHVSQIVSKVAAHDTIVLIRGESGTGKELIAEAIHRQSRRAQKPLVKVNCAALVETLLLSELFGHERGAFTGAQSRKKGRFELADGGTLFLDEIGDVSPKTQVALLRVLQEQEFERVGGTQPIRVDVRIVCATHRDLEKMVREGSFREDLYYRLRGVTIETPPLRRRLEDLGELTSHLLARIASERGEAPHALSRDALALLAQHRWPGNVRELENVLRSATLFTDSELIGERDVLPLLEGMAPLSLEPEGEQPIGAAEDVERLAYERLRSGSTSLFDLKKDLERECITRALVETSGNITRAAALLGMKRPRLSQLVKEYELGDAGK